ncbi:transglycosylase SLT domain-containing protein [Aliifodinibius sp. S!AR15-10]|uniref:transglycosylase SLT domain-containing protein n=1 Tax=Aliifodinibius sp. S!AR15-10 TaxID=2950437 RepID=UPI0038F609F7
MAASWSIPAELTYIRLRGVMGYFSQASRRYGLPLTLLLAVASRESRMGLALDAKGTGDHGNGIGIMQIDRRHHPGFTGAHSGLDHAPNIDYGAKYLGQLIGRFGGNLHQAVAAYNAGPTRVAQAIRAGQDPDRVTTGGDYARDVLARRDLIRRLLPVARPSMLAVPIGLMLLAGYLFITETRSNQPN